MKTYIAYLRQSTMKQQISGLGVEAQREIIHNHVKNKPILAEYIETVFNINLGDFYHTFLEILRDGMKKYAENHADGESPVDE